MDTKDLIEELNNADLSFKRFEWWGGLHYLTCKYLDIALFPSLDFFIDAQMNETFDWKDENGIHESYVGIGLHFDWLGFNVGFQINFKTNKPLNNESMDTCECIN